MGIHGNLLSSHTGYYDTSYFRSAFIKVRKFEKTAKNATSDCFRSNLCDAAFCMAQSFGRLLVWSNMSCFVDIVRKLWNCHRLLICFMFTSSWRISYCVNDLFALLHLKIICSDHRWRYIMYETLKCFEFILTKSELFLMENNAKPYLFLLTPQASVPCDFVATLLKEFLM